MAIYYLSADLMFGIQVQQAAKQLDLDLKSFTSDTSLVEALTVDTQLVIADLMCPNCDIVSLVSHCKSHSDQMRVVAYGPHVQTHRLDQARQAGCDQVLTNGQFHSDIAGVLRV